jgi:hypothetical protein
MLRKCRFITVVLMLVATAALLAPETLRAQYAKVIPSARREPIGCTATANGATLTCAAPAASGKTTRLYAFTVTCTATGATVEGQVTLSDGIWTMPYQLVETSSGGQLQDQFPPIDASAADTPITLTIPAVSGGGTCSAVLIYSQQAV